MKIPMQMGGQILSDSGVPLKIRVFGKRITFTNGEATVSRTDLDGVNVIGGVIAQASEGSYTAMVRASSNADSIGLRAIALNSNPPSVYTGTINVTLLVFYT